jgi:hypothetical protein
VVELVGGPPVHERNFHNWSPDGRRLSIAPAGDGSEARLFLFDVNTGLTVRVIDAAAGATGGIFHRWLTDEILLIHQSGPEPMLLDLRQPTLRPTPILSQLLDHNISYPGDTMAFGVYPADSGDDEDFIIFVAVREPAAEGIYIYHSATGEVERLPYDRPTHLFFPDGRAVFVDKFEWDNLGPEPDGPDRHQLYWVGTAGGRLSQIEIVGHQPRGNMLQTLWLPDTSQMVFASSQGMSLVSLPDGQLLDFWRLTGTEDPVQTALVQLSPNKQTLIVQAITQGADFGPPETYLYAIPLTRRDQ